MKKTIGILGGMGPEATAYFYELIIQNTKAEKDQEHIKTLIYSNPEVPPRTDAILNKGPSPVPFLIEGVRRLQQAGADFIVIPCVTAHAFLPEVQAQLDFPLIHLVDETVNWSKAHIPGLKKAGLIASTGTVTSELFHRAFAESDIELLTPDAPAQDRVMEAIFGEQGIKAGFSYGFPREILVNTAKILIARGADAIIAGCTEVPLVLTDRDIPVPLIEPLRIAARACILEAGYQLKK